MDEKDALEPLLARKGGARTLHQLLQLACAALDDFVPSRVRARAGIGRPPSLPASADHAVGLEARGARGAGSPQDGQAAKVLLQLLERLEAMPTAPAKAFVPLLHQVVSHLERHDLLRLQAQAVGVVRTLSRWAPPTTDGADGYAQRMALQRRIQALHRG